MARHPRDALISFQEEGHLYSIRGMEGHPTSVTTLIHTLFPEFDADVVVDRMMSSRSWPTSRYYGQTKEQIKLQWEQLREQASRDGTAMHRCIELFLNDPEARMPAAPTPEFGLFLQFWQEILDGSPWRPLRIEWTVYDVPRRLAGSIDLVLHDPTDPRGRRVVLVDWKRSKEIKRQNHFQCGRACWAHLDDCNWNHYRLQLNLYRHMLETLYDKQVVAMWLVVLHPSNTRYQLIMVERMEREIHDVMALLPLPQQQ